MITAEGSLQVHAPHEEETRWRSSVRKRPTAPKRSSSLPPTRNASDMFVVDPNESLPPPIAPPRKTSQLDKKMVNQLGLQTSLSVASAATIKQRATSNPMMVKHSDLSTLSADPSAIITPPASPNNQPRRMNTVTATDSFMSLLDGYGSVAGGEDGGGGPTPIGRNESYAPTLRGRQTMDSLPRLRQTQISSLSSLSRQKKVSKREASSAGGGGVKRSLSVENTSSERQQRRLTLNLNSEDESGAGEHLFQAMFDILKRPLTVEDNQALALALDTESRKTPVPLNTPGGTPKLRQDRLYPTIVDVSSVQSNGSNTSPLRLLPMQSVSIQSSNVSSPAGQQPQQHPIWSQDVPNLNGSSHQQQQHQHQQQQPELLVNMPVPSLDSRSTSPQTTLSSNSNNLLYHPFSNSPQQIKGQLQHLFNVGAASVSTTPRQLQSIETPSGNFNNNQQLYEGMSLPMVPTTEYRWQDAMMAPPQPPLKGPSPSQNDTNNNEIAGDFMLPPLPFGGGLPLPPLPLPNVQVSTPLSQSSTLYQNSLERSSPKKSPSSTKLNDANLPSVCGGFSDARPGWTGFTTAATPPMMFLPPLPFHPNHPYQYHQFNNQQGMIPMPPFLPLFVPFPPPPPQSGPQPPQPAPPNSQPQVQTSEVQQQPPQQEQQQQQPQQPKLTPVIVPRKSSLVWKEGQKPVHF